MTTDNKLTRYRWAKIVYKSVSKATEHFSNLGRVLAFLICFKIWLKDMWYWHDVRGIYLRFWLENEEDSYKSFLEEFENQIKSLNHER